MSSDPAAAPASVTIKKYANRRLYNTGTSAYVTLEDLATMVKRGQDFSVYDAKTGDDITRSVLAQIIFEQEGKGGQSLLPIAFLRQLIRFYGTSMQMLVPSYLEFTLDKLTKDSGGMHDQFAAAFSHGPLATMTRPMFAQIEEQTKKNMAVFRQALSMFGPFGAATGPVSARSDAATHAPETSAGSDGLPPQEKPTADDGSDERALEADSGRGADLDDMRRQLNDMQRQIAGLMSQRDPS